jgi:hypothetical protein
MKTQLPDNVISVKNDSGSLITKGTLINYSNAVAGSGDKCLGVCTADSEDGEMMPVATLGIVNVNIADGTNIVKGKRLISSSGGGVSVADETSLSSVNTSCGIALEDYSAGMTVISMLITH